MSRSEGGENGVEGRGGFIVLAFCFFLSLFFFRFSFFVFFMGGKEGGFGGFDDDR
jgi:hypothetical protein